MYSYCRLFFFVLMFCCYQVGHAETEVCETHYVFSWGQSDLCNDSPRGGSSNGADVEISTEPHAGWLAIQNPEFDKFEKDRAAILAMAGGYRVDFHFLETVGFSENFTRDRPYHSWGTEYVYVVENQPEFISLQHVMVMYFKQDDGTTSEPFIMKHWRQDWVYEDDVMLEYSHDDQWTKRTVSRKERKGAWSQAVFQVDDSPRYESIGRWQHNASFSTWLSGTTRRPLPRRERSIRQDYQALEGFNRHTVTRYGWVQEEDNWKLVLDESGEASTTEPYISKELGVARYRLTANVDFSPGNSYMEETSLFWATVRHQWGQLIDENSSIKVARVVDNQPLFIPLFDYANQLREKDVEISEQTTFINETIEKYIK